MDCMTILDKIQKGLGKIAVIFKRRRFYSWAVFNAYLFGVALKRDAVSAPMRMEGRNVRKYMTGCEKFIMGFSDGECHGGHVIVKIKSVIGKVLDKKGRQFGMWERFVLERKVKQIVSEVDKMIDSGEIGKIRLAAQCILYLQIVAMWSDLIKKDWLIDRKKRVEKMIEDWCKSNNRENDALMFRLTKNSRWLRTIDAVQHPKYWLVWVIE